MKKERLKPVLSFDSITDQQWAEAMWSTAQYITYKLNGNPQTGIFSCSFLGVSAAEFFSRLAFDVLFTRQWKLKEDFTLKQQMKKAADGLMSNHKKHCETIEVPVMESFEDYCEMLVDTLEDNDENLDITYELAELAVADDPELLEFLHQMRRCASYDDIADEMNLTINDVYNLSRKLKRRLKMK